MKKTFAYLRIEASGLQHSQRPGVTECLTLNRDPGPGLTHKSVELQYPDCFRIREDGAASGTPGRREMLDSEGRTALLNGLLQDGLITARVFTPPGLEAEGRVIRSLADLRVSGDTEYGHSDFCPRPCAHCGGTGKVTALVDCADRRQSGPRQINCLDCGGSGTITPEKLDRMAAGAAVRADRIARDLSLREEAARLGITPSALSRLERGELRIGEEDAVESV